MEETEWYPHPGTRGGWWNKVVLWCYGLDSASTAEKEVSSSSASLSLTPLRHRQEAVWRSRLASKVAQLEQAWWQWLKTTSFFRSFLLFAVLQVVFLLLIVLAFALHWYGPSRTATFRDPQSLAILTLPITTTIGPATSFWAKDAQCGLNGVDCLPFTTASPVAVYCPPASSSVWLRSPYTVGNALLNYQPLLVGGVNALYRGDSWLCASAVLAGKLEDATGGDMAFQLTGSAGPFTAQSGAGLTSVGFDAVFPQSYRLLDPAPQDDASTLPQFTVQTMWPLPVFISLFALVFTRLPPLFYYWSWMISAYWFLNAVSEPRSFPPSLQGIFADFLPFLFTAYCIYRVAVRFTLPRFTMLKWQSALLYLPAFWVGAHMGPLTVSSPLDRLTSSDIQARSGALALIVILVLVILGLGIYQLGVLRRRHLLPSVCGWYAALGVLIAIFATSIRSLSFRLHHYSLALLLLPLTRVPTRFAALCQAFLLGLFVSGIARWGFASLLETALTLQRDGPAGTAMPFFTGIDRVQQQILWSPPAAYDAAYWNKYGLLVNDVLLYRGNATAWSYASIANASQTDHLYFRVALATDGNAVTIPPGYADFSAPATLTLSTQTLVIA